MKKFLLFLMLFIGTNIVFASEFEAVLNDQQVFFSTQGWSKEANIDNSQVLTKKSLSTSYPLFIDLLFCIEPLPRYDRQ